MTYKIEKNVPLPAKASIYPLDDMSVGDSFAIPREEKIQTEKMRNRISAAICSYRKKHPDRAFATRSETSDAGEHFQRVWRVK